MPEAALSNPERLLLALDALLDHRVNLVLYGRSAVWLGFENPPPAVGATKDVDAIIRMSQLDELVNDEQFWDSRDAVNEQFKGEGQTKELGKRFEGQAQGKELYGKGVGEGQAKGLYASGTGVGQAKEHRKRAEGRGHAKEP